MSDRRVEGVSTAVRELAAAHGILLSYHDYRGVERSADDEALLAALRALGAEVDAAHDAPQALRAHREAVVRRGHEPVVVAWDGRCEAISLVVAASRADDRLTATIEFEDGAAPPRSVAAPIRRRERLESGDEVIHLTAALEATLPFGVHRMHLDHGGATTALFVIAAPRRPGNHDRPPARRLGAFMPLYALRSERSGAIADLTDLRRFGEWITERGGRFLSTLPLLSSYLDEPFNPSPYVPVSRLFFNELFLDIEAAPEFAACEAARRIVAGDAFMRESRRLAGLGLVDYRSAMALKRPPLEALAATAFAHDATRARLDDFALERPWLDDYARFRAVVEHRRGDWHTWPDDGRANLPRTIDPADPARRYHLYVQWLLDRQLSALAESLHAHDAALYLDLPVGVHGGGFDAWRFRDQFMSGLDVGAPPDPLFTGGQNWATPPMHPDAIRADGYRYWRQVLRNHFRHSKMLRIDHVMALHRLYCVPRGRPATDGLYLRYRAEELLAILCLEAHRAGALVVGENLGTVPPETNLALREHGLHGMWIGQFAFQGDAAHAIPAPPAGQLAALNSHDTPTFAGYWSGRDLDLRRDLGISDDAELAPERAGRAHVRRAIGAFLAARGMIADTDAPLHEILAAILETLAEGDSELLLVNLEDLWLETEPQNVPGIAEGYPSWRRRSARALEEIAGDRRLAGLMERLAAALAGGREAAPQPAGRTP